MKYEMIIFRCPEDPTEKHILKLEFATERDRELTALSYIIYEANLKEILFTDPQTNESRIYFKKENKPTKFDSKSADIHDLIESVGDLIDDLIENCTIVLNLMERIKNGEQEER